MKRILITGASGMLGSSLAFNLKNEYEVYGTYLRHKIEPKFCKNCRFMKLDIGSPASLKRIIKINPEIVIHAAALTDVGLCETNPELAERINVWATGNLVEICRKTDSKIVYISTDYVFDGGKGNYNEKDKPMPANAYGKTKLRAEKIVSGLNDYLILRTSLYGWHRHKSSFEEWLIDSLREEKELHIVKDQFNSPLYAGDFSEILKNLLRKEAKGLYHIGNTEGVSKHEFSLKLAEAFGLDKNLVKPITTKELAKRIKQKVKPLRDTRLDSSKAINEFGIEIPPITEGLNRMRLSENLYKLNPFFFKKEKGLHPKKKIEKASAKRKLF